MKAEIIKGDLFNTDCVVICHQVNCMGVMGSGVAKIVKQRYPKVFEEYKRCVDNLNHDMLGGCLLVDTGDGKYIANISAQYYYKGCKIDYSHLQNPYNQPSLSPNPTDEFFSDDTPLRYTNYEAFYTGLTKLLMDMNLNKIKSVAFPYKIGSDRGGADWNVILSMINSVFENTDITVKVYKLYE